MSNHATAQCPECGNKATTVDQDASHYLHGALHGIQHGMPVMATVLGGIAVDRKIRGKKFTCQTCGHEFRR